MTKLNGNGDEATLSYFTGGDEGRRKLALSFNSAWLRTDTYFSDNPFHSKQCHSTDLSIESKAARITRKTKEFGLLKVEGCPNNCQRAKI